MDQLGNIDFRALQIFLVLMSERSVTKTSIAVGVSQPAITQALNRLRQAFGDPLLVRGQSAMLPTERAVALEREIKRFFDSIADMQLPQDDFDPGAQTRDIIVTAPEYMELLLLPPVSRVLRQSAPGVTLRVRSPDHRQISELLASGEVDFRIGWVRDPQPSTRAMPLFEDDIVVIAGPGNTSVGQGLTLETFVRLPHIRLFGDGRTTSGRVIDEFMRQQGASLKISIYAQSLFAMLDALRSSDVVATIPRRMAHRIRESFPVRIATFPGDLPPVNNYLYWHERTHRSPVHRWFRTRVSEAAQQVSDRKEPG